MASEDVAELSIVRVGPSRITDSNYILGQIVLSRQILICISSPEYAQELEIVSKCQWPYIYILVSPRYL